MSASPHLQPLAPHPPLRRYRDANDLRGRAPRRPRSGRHPSAQPPTAPPPSPQSSAAPAPTRRPTPRRRPKPKQRSKPKQHLANRGLAAETVLKLIVNGVLSAGAIFTLMNLFPYYWAQQAKLQEVRQQTQAIEQEVIGLQEDFNRSFDPSQAQSVMQDQSGLLAPNKRRVVLTNQDPNQ